jgi:hypothetical protein
LDASAVIRQSVASKVAIVMRFILYFLVFNFWQIQ